MNAASVLGGLPVACQVALCLDISASQAAFPLPKIPNILDWFSKKVHKW